MFVTQVFDLDTFLVMKRIFPLILFAIALCSCSQTEHTEAVTAEITAAQMEGRNAARSIINKEWKDTVALRQEIDTIYSRKRFYIENGYPDRAEAFDSALVRTVRAVRPELIHYVHE